jgi:hypothetical protein
MTKTTLVKFRATAALKAELEATAARHGLTVSALLRGAAHNVAVGRPADGGVRADMARVRRTANAIAALIAGETSPSADSLAHAADDLRAIAVRHLGPTL